MLGLGFVFIVSRVILGLVHESTPDLVMTLYKDAAHFYMGALLVCWLQASKPWKRSQFRTLFWALCIVEVAVAAWTLL